MVKFKCKNKEILNYLEFSCFLLLFFIHSQHFFLHDYLSFLFHFAASIPISFTLLISDVVRDCHNTGLSNVRVFSFSRSCARNVAPVKISIRINIYICVERIQIYYQKTALRRCVIRYSLAFLPHCIFDFLFYFLRQKPRENGRHNTVVPPIAKSRCKACVTVTLLDEDESDDEEDGPPRELSGSENNEEPEDKNLKSIIHNGESHTCPTKQERDVAAGGVAVVFSPSETARVICVKDEMKVMTQELALSETKMSSISIAQRVQDKIERKYHNLPFKGLNSCLLKSIFHYTRRKEFADWEGAIASFPLVLCSDDDDRLFLQFNATVNLQKSLQ